MKLKSNFRCDRYGNIYYRKTINGNRVTIPAYTKDVSIANKLYKTLEYQALMDQILDLIFTKILIAEKW